MRDGYTFVKELGVKNARFYIELELDPAELQAIGHVSAQWAFLEFHILEYTKLVCDAVLNQPLPKEAESDSLRKRKRTWETVVNEAYKNEPKLLAQITAIIDRVGSLQGERQRLIHGLIQWDDKDREKLNVYTRANPNNVPWKVDAAQIQALARKIATLNADFFNCHNENPDYPDLSQPRQPLSRRPGIPIPAEIGPEFSGPAVRILAAHKPQKPPSAK